MRFMKKGKQLLACMLAAMLVAGALELPAIAADASESSEAYEVVEVSESEVSGSEEGQEESSYGTENVNAESSGGAVTEDAAAGGEEAVLTVVFDANGGFFVDEWDDTLNETVEKAEVLYRTVPAGGTVTVFPVPVPEDGDAEFAGWSLEQDGAPIPQEEEGFAPAENCTLFAVWEAAEPEEEIEEEIAEEESEPQEPGEIPPSEEEQEIEEQAEETSDDVSEDAGNDDTDETAEPEEEEEPAAEEVSPEQTDIETPSVDEEQDDQAAGTDSEAEEVSEEENTDADSETPSESEQADYEDTEQAAEEESEIDEQQPAAEDGEEAKEEIKPDEEESVSSDAKNAVITGTLNPGITDINVSAGQTVYYSFTPSSNGDYVFFSGPGSGSSQDTYGYLYDGNMNELTYNDDGGLDRNFYIKYTLKGNTTYYLGVKFWSSSSSGVIKVAAARVCSAVVLHINNGGDTGYFAYIPKTSGEQEFYSDNGGEDTRGYLYGPDLNLLTSNDDGGGEYGYNFHFSYSLQAGTTYLIGANYYSSTKTGSIWVYSGHNDIANASVSVPVRYYTGSALKPACTVKMGSKTLTKGTDYKVTYSNNVNAGKATLSIMGIGKYTGSKSVKFTIKPCAVSKTTVSVSSPVRTYTGKVQKPAVVVKFGSRTLKKGTDYAVAYKNNKNVGKPTIVITGKRNFTGKVNKTFTIKKCAVSKVTVSVPARTYTGQALKPALVVKLNGVTLKKGLDYTVTYKNNKNAGKGTAVVTGYKNLSGKLNKQFTINKAAPKLKFASSSVTKEKGNSAFTNKLTKVTDGTVRYTSSKSGVATVNSSSGLVTIKGKGAATITVTASAGRNYKAGKATYKLTVLKANAFRLGRDNWNFTNSSYYFGYDRYIDQINSSHLAKLKNNMKNSEYKRAQDLLYSYWGGSCYGMSVLELLGKERLVPYSTYQPGATKLNQLYAPCSNSNVSSLITYYHALQLTDAVQQVAIDCSNRSNKTNIKNILSALNSHSTCLIGFTMYQGGHAILATDYKYGSYTWNGKTYQGCIVICDPNHQYSTAYNSSSNLYFNTSTYSWTIPDYDGYLTGDITLVCASKSTLNSRGCLNGSSSGTASRYTARLDTNEIGDDHSVSKIQAVNDSYVNVYSDSKDIEKADSVILGGSQGRTPGYNLYDSSSAYKVTQSRAGSMDLSLKYEDSFLEAESGAGQSAIFDRDGFVEVNGNDADFRLSMTFDRNYPTDWFTVEISGNSGKRVSVRKTDAGYVVSGDKLKNITVSANNKNNTVTKVFSTSAGEACICQKSDGTMDIRIDADHDGTFEKSVVTR